MESLDGSLLNINAICADLGQKWLQLLGMYVLSGCDTTFYPYGKGNVTALNTIVSRIYQCLAIIGDIDTTHTELMNATMPSFVHYSQPPVTSMESTCYNIFTKKKRNPKVMALPPTSANLAPGSSSNNVVESSRLQVSQEMSHTLGGSFESNIYTGHC